MRSCSRTSRKSALVRLEALREVPTSRKDRARAALVLKLYGFELEEFGVSDADLPPVIDMRALDALPKDVSDQRKQDGGESLPALRPLLIPLAA